MSEFAVSQKAKAAGIPNIIPDGCKPAIRALVVSVLQPVCDVTGWRCRINSGYRSERVNALVGGAFNSQHMKGEAADCVFMDKDGPAQSIDVLRRVKELGLTFDQMIAYPTFVHLSYATGRQNRKQVLYSAKYNGPRL